jgi:hypothetical protein
MNYQRRKLFGNIESSILLIKHTHTHKDKLYNKHC